MRETARWLVNQKGGDQWRLRLVDREFNFQNPGWERLFTVATACAAGRRMDLHGVEHLVFWSETQPVRTSTCRRTGKCTFRSLTG